MANITKWQGAGLVRAMLLGFSGSGKTGGLAPLASAGYNVRILDMENKLGALLNVLTDEKSPYKKDAASRVSTITLKEPRKIVNKRPIISAPTVYTKALDLLTHWKDDQEDLGSPSEWTDRDILVIDSLSAFSKAAMRQVLAMNGRPNARPFESDWGVAQDMIDDFIELLTGDMMGCHVLVICHLVPIAQVGEAVPKWLPQTVGKALSPKIGRYFDAALMFQTTGQGINTKRKIHTNNTSMVELKNTAPLRCLPEYPLETGLADYFLAVRGTTPGAVK